MGPLHHCFIITVIVLNCEIEPKFGSLSLPQTFLHVWKMSCRKPRVSLPEFFSTWVFLSTSLRVCLWSSILYKITCKEELRPSVPCRFKFLGSTWLDVRQKGGKGPNSERCSVPLGMASPCQKELQTRWK